MGSSAHVASAPRRRCRGCGAEYAAEDAHACLAMSDPVLPSALMPRGGRQPGAGRPPRSDESARESHTIQFTPSEWADIVKAAKQADTTPGRWLREVGVRVARGE